MRSIIKILLDTIIGYFFLFRMIFGSYLVGCSNKMRGSTSSGILFIAWYLPPSISSGVYRPLSFLKYAGKNKIEMTCLSGYLEEKILESGRFLLASLPDNIPIKRVNKIDIKPSWQFFPRIQQNVFVDAIAIYFEAIKIYDECPPKVIIATGPPFSDFVAATFLAIRYSSKLVLDYRDEWSERPIEFIDKSPQDKYWETFCLKYSNAVILTTKSQVEHLLGVFPFLDKAKCHYLPNGWELEYTKFFSQDCYFNNSSDIVISFVGHLGAHLDFGEFLICIAKIIERNDLIKNNLKIRLIGDLGEKAKKSIVNFKHNQIIDIVGHVSKHEIIKYTNESDILLIMSYKGSERYRPIKLYDYLASNRPILVYGTGGEVKNVVCNLNVGFYVKTGDSIGLENALLESKTYSINEITKAKIDGWMAKHERNVLAQSFFNIIDDLLQD